MRKPTIHPNGSGRAALYSGYEAAVLALDVAIDAAAQTAPHGRDYYPQGDEAIDEAVAEHQDRLRKLHAVKEELEKLAVACMPR